MSQLIFSVDPSMTCTGWALLACGDDYRGDVELVHSGKIRPSDKDDEFTRGQDLADRLLMILREYYPDRGVFERANPVYHGRRANRRNHLVYVQAVNLVEYVLCQQLGAPQVYGFYAETWKQTEKKRITVRRANLLFRKQLATPLSETADHDIADAIMLGTWFIERQRIHQLPSIKQCTC